MLDFFGSIGHAIMVPLYYAVSFVLVGFHRGLSSLGMDPAGGLTWVLGQRTSPTSLPDSSELFLQQVTYEVTPALIIAGVLGVVVWIALGAVKGKPW